MKIEKLPRESQIWRDCWSSYFWEISFIFPLKIYPSESSRAVRNLWGTFFSQFRLSLSVARGIAKIIIMFLQVQLGTTLFGLEERIIVRTRQLLKPFYDVTMKSNSHLGQKWGLCDRNKWRQCPRCKVM